MSSDRDEDEEDQPGDEDKDKDSNWKQSQTNPSFFEVITISLKPPKPFITKYLESMSIETPIMYTPKEKHRYNTVIAQQESNTTKCKVQNEDSLEDIE